MWYHLLLGYPGGRVHTDFQNVCGGYQSGFILIAK